MFLHRLLTEKDETIEDYFVVGVKVYCQPFHDRGRYHIETSPLICSANHFTGFYMITASVMKGLRVTTIFSGTHIFDTCLKKLQKYYFIYQPKEALTKILDGSTLIRVERMYHFYTH